LKNYVNLALSLKNYKMAEKTFKVLVVDDEPDILEFLSYNLEKEGFVVETAENGNKH
jgi:CheY-like chemotaxis protein